MCTSSEIDVSMIITSDVVLYYNFHVFLLQRWVFHVIFETALAQLISVHKLTSKYLFCLNLGE